ncbi:MAG TPA: DUF2442 domain-containing protein [Tepidisphaeraceae bacterium]|jgi:hypothetical protein
MSPLLIKVRPVVDYQLELTFDDGLVAVVDFAKDILDRHGVFEPLHDLGYFRQAYVHSESGTLTWPNDVDYCPDVLYSLASGKPIEGIGPPPTSSSGSERAKAG